MPPFFPSVEVYSVSSSRNGRPRSLTQSSLRAWRRGRASGEERRGRELVGFCSQVRCVRPFSIFAWAEHILLWSISCSSSMYSKNFPLHPEVQFHTGRLTRADGGQSHLRGFNVVIRCWVRRNVSDHFLPSVLSVVAPPSLLLLLHPSSLHQLLRTATGRDES